MLVKDLKRFLNKFICDICRILGILILIQWLAISDFCGRDTSSLIIRRIVSRDIIGKSSVFKQPRDLKVPTSHKKWLHWLKTWTPVVDCGVTQSGYVILVMLAGEDGRPYMRNYDPEGDMYEGGFFIDIYDREGNMIAGGLHTPHRFLCVDPKDNIWFDLRPDTPENPGPPLSKGRSKPEKEPPAVLGKFKLNLPLAASKNVGR